MILEVVFKSVACNYYIFWNTIHSLLNLDIDFAVVVNASEVILIDNLLGYYVRGFFYIFVMVHWCVEMKFWYIYTLCQWGVLLVWYILWWLWLHQGNQLYFLQQLVMLCGFKLSVVWCHILFFCVFISDPEWLVILGWIIFYLIHQPCCLHLV